MTAPQTRAGMTTEDLQKFQLHIVNEGNESYSYNTRMEKKDGEWGSFELVSDVDDNLIPMMMLWQNKTQPVKVVALAGLPTWIDEYTWHANCTISVNNVQNTEVLLKEADILYMTEKVIDPSSDDLVEGKIPIVFNHRLSKLNLTVKMGTEFNKLEGGTTTNLISDMEVNGTSIKAFWYILEDNMLTDPNAITIITPWHNSAAYSPGKSDTTQAVANYECMLIPQTVEADNFSVSFKIGDRIFSWSNTTELVLAADTQYNLTLNVGHDVVTVGGFTATPWTEAEAQNLETE